MTDNITERSREEHVESITSRWLSNLRTQKEAEEAHNGALMGPEEEALMQYSRDVESADRNAGANPLGRHFRNVLQGIEQIRDEDIDVKRSPHGLVKEVKFDEDYWREQSQVVDEDVYAEAVADLDLASQWENGFGTTQVLDLASQRGREMREVREQAIEEMGLPLGIWPFGTTPHNIFKSVDLDEIGVDKPQTTTENFAQVFEREINTFPRYVMYGFGMPDVTINQLIASFQQNALGEIDDEVYEIAGNPDNKPWGQVEQALNLNVGRMLKGDSETPGLLDYGFLMNATTANSPRYEDGERILNDIRNLEVWPRTAHSEFLSEDEAENRFGNPPALHRRLVEETPYSEPGVLTAEDYVDFVAEQPPYFFVEADEQYLEVLDADADSPSEYFGEENQSKFNVTNSVWRNGSIERDLDSLAELWDKGEFTGTVPRLVNGELDTVEVRMDLEEMPDDDYEHWAEYAAWKNTNSTVWPYVRPRIGSFDGSGAFFESRAKCIQPDRVSFGNGNSVGGVELAAGDDAATMYSWPEMVEAFKEAANGYTGTPGEFEEMRDAHQTLDSEFRGRTFRDIMADVYDETDRESALEYVTESGSGIPARVMGYNQAVLDPQHEAEVPAARADDVAGDRDAVMDYVRSKLSSN